MRRLSDQFDILCQERYKEGAEEYGSFTFLENDVIRMLAEELADTANYCRMHFIKIMMLSDMLAMQHKDETEEMGMGSFKGVGETGWTG